MPYSHFKKAVACACLPAMVLPGLATAQSVDAHTHGEAELQLALEGTRLQIRFQSPASDVFGFEHNAMNARQREIVSSRMAMMEQADWLIGELAESCKLEQVELNSSIAAIMASETNAHNHSDHAHDEHDHEDHAQESHEDHDHEEGETHSEVVVSYQLDCTSAPTEITITAFEHLESLEHIEAQWLTEETQGGAELSASNNRIQL